MSISGYLQSCHISQPLPAWITHTPQHVPPQHFSLSRALLQLLRIMDLSQLTLSLRDKIHKICGRLDRASLRTQRLFGQSLITGSASREKLVHDVRSLSRETTAPTIAETTDACLALLREIDQKLDHLSNWNAALAEGKMPEKEHGPPTEQQLSTDADPTGSALLERLWPELMCGRMSKDEARHTAETMDATRALLREINAKLDRLSDSDAGLAEGEMPEEEHGQLTEQELSACADPTGSTYRERLENQLWFGCMSEEKARADAEMMIDNLAKAREISAKADHLLSLKAKAARMDLLLAKDDQEEGWLAPPWAAHANKTREDSALESRGKVNAGAFTGSPVDVSDAQQSDLGGKSAEH